jgi:hypothetical protein
MASGFVTKNTFCHPLYGGKLGNSSLHLKFLRQQNPGNKKKSYAGACYGIIV